MLHEHLVMKSYWHFNGKPHGHIKVYHQQL